uniref:3-hydroxybenzoate 6-hydroxylase 1 n=1 Tax=Aquipseudomonas alcaligenes TaxID=43263 RepID=3HBH1_AQUAC|nr:RecName: Full=3-hydroxybenzoate 6-hydroxylase 1; AltName: Full=Constitutive 3-hydroxybenzoate 6-hydroxylase [Pseudomonas alcaligenes]AAG39455.1 probable 3-hydroxybenzoate 6-hydroxylase [Pseudomonas alcaligenes]
MHNNILIAGAGIGGLSAALGLARKGMRSIVLEKAPELGEIGAGIQLAPNAYHALDALGIGEVARQTGVHVDKLLWMDGMTDKEIASVPLANRFREFFGNPYAVIHRADFHGLLVEACHKTGLVEVRTNAEVVDYENFPDRVEAILHDGSCINGAVLVGADGLWSNVRQKVIGDGDPRVSGHTTYRSVIPAEDMPEELRWNMSTAWAGEGCHMVHYPLKGGKVFNLVLTSNSGASEPEAGVPVTTDEVFEKFKTMKRRPTSLIHKGNNWKRWVLCDRDPLPNWVDGRVTLLGDAAHPMMQYMAQGASMAIEDAVCLAFELGREMDPVSALKKYNRARFARTARVQTYSRYASDFIYHAKGGAAAMRNELMGGMTPTDFFQWINWLYGKETVEKYK